MSITKEVSQGAHSRELLGHLGKLPILLLYRMVHRVAAQPGQGAIAPFDLRNCHMQMQ